MHCRNSAGWIDAAFSTRKFKREEKSCLEKSSAILELTGLFEFRHHHADSLPYGYQRKLEIARALATDPEVIMLDEPVAGMNEHETSALLSFVSQLREMGYSIVVIEHDMRFVMSLCDKIYVLNYGILIAEGTPEEIKRNPLVLEAYLGKGVS